MASTTAICNSFKKELLEGVHAFGTDTFKVALYTSSATHSKTTTAYSATNEISGTNYTAAGETLDGVSVAASGDSAVLDFTDEVWSTATFTAASALIYNSSKSNKAVAVYDFGGDVTATAADFTVQFPVAAAGTALVEIS